MIKIKQILSCCTIGLFAASVYAQAPAAWDAQFLAQDYSQPIGVKQLAPDDKSFTYYAFPEMLKRADAFIIWMREGNKAADSVVRDAAEFRGYALAYLELADVDWRKKCESPTAMETPNAIVLQMAQSISGIQKPEEVKHLGGEAVVSSMMLRCINRWPQWVK